MLRDEIAQVIAIAREIAKEEIAKAFKGVTPLANDEAKKAAKEAKIEAKEAKTEADKNK